MKLCESETESERESERGRICEKVFESEEMCENDDERGGSPVVCLWKVSERLCTTI